MQSGWITQVFNTCELGVSSAYEPQLIPDNQLAWLKNGRVRGGKASARPTFRQCLVLPSGHVQGVSYFSIQNGMLVIQVDGNLYRIRINNKDFSYEAIPLPWRNSARLPYAWMCETVGNLVIQDGQSDAIIYDGSTARRSDPTKSEVPRGRQMAFGNGRLWVAVDANDVVAGDIKTDTFGSELLFTESQYFSGGGAFFFPFSITGMAFIPASGSAGYGSLMIYGKNQTQGIRADIAQRNLWPDFPGFIQAVLLDAGTASHFSLTQVNQDIYWKDGSAGIRSIRSESTEEVSGPGNAPISREISRITDFESVDRLDGVSGILFNNRLIMTASPFINHLGFTSYKNLVSLDFAPLSSNRGKAPPAYDGQWEGLNLIRIVQGEFRGKRRAFFVSLDQDGSNRLWELVDNGLADEFTTCFDFDNRVPMVMEFPSRNFGDPKRRKRLERCDVYISGMRGQVSIDVYWRSDNNKKWVKWDGNINTQGVSTDPSTNVPHVFKNLVPEQIPQIMTFTIPQDLIDYKTSRGFCVGFDFQLRVVVTGNAQVEKCVAYAIPLEEEQFTDREMLLVTQTGTDVTGNEINYSIPLGPCVDPGVYVPIYLFYDTINQQMGGFVYGLGTIPGVTAAWFQLSGPAGGVSFADQGDPTTIATFSIAGTYVLRLQGNYQDGPIFDDVTIEVRLVTWKINNSVGFWNFVNPPPHNGYNPGLSNEHLLVWVKTGDNTRLLVKDISPAELLANINIDFTTEMKAPAIVNLPGFNRELFITVTSSGSEYVLSTGVISSPYIDVAQGQLPLTDGPPFILDFPEAGYGPFIPFLSGYDASFTYDVFHQVTSVLLPDYTKYGAGFVSDQSKPA